MNLTYVNYQKYQNKIKNIYYKAFPRIERFPFWILKYTAKENKSTLNTILDNDKVVGMQFIVNCDSLYYLMYFAIDEKHRNKNYGSTVLCDLRKKYKNIFLSIEKPTNDLSIRRKNFYLRNGFLKTDKYYEDRGVIYEILCTNRDYVITEEVLKKRYINMSNSKILKYIIGKIFNVSKIKFIQCL